SLSKGIALRTPKVKPAKMKPPDALVKNEIAYFDSKITVEKFAIVLNVIAPVPKNSRKNAIRIIKTNAPTLEIKCSMTFNVSSSLYIIFTLNKMSDKYSEIN